MQLKKAVKHFWTRYIREALMIIPGVLLVCSMAAVVSELDSSSHSTVYAVNSGDEHTGRQVQTGLMGVVRGVSDMEKYSDSARMISVVDANEEVLAGVAKVDRRVSRRSSIGGGTSIAGSLGYYAEQTVYSHQMDEEDYYALLQIVEAEATGEDITGKMLVAGVVLNRVEDENFPDNVVDVVLEDNQFQPVADGRYYSVEVTEDTVEAVERVMQGENLTQGALYFFSRDTSEATNVDWFDSSLVSLFTYGGHEYFTFSDV